MMNQGCVCLLSPCCSLVPLCSRVSLWVRVVFGGLGSALHGAEIIAVRNFQPVGSVAVDGITQAGSSKAALNSSPCKSRDELTHLTMPQFPFQ